MPQYVDEYDDDTDFEGDPRESNALREVRKALRAAEKRAKELEAEVSEFRTQTRQSVVKSSLEARGLNPKIAAFVPSDVTDADGISKWLDEYGDVFGAVTTTAPEEGAGVPADVARHEATVASGASPTGDETQMAALIQGAKTPAELNQILFGNPNGPNLNR